MTTMLQTLDETAAAYTSRTRATSLIGGGCRYFIANKCCAVGRCLEDPVIFKDKQCSVTSLDNDYDLESILKSKYRGFPLKFWMCLQNLHDLACNWDENGLSDAGKKQVDNIKKEFKL